MQPNNQHYSSPKERKRLLVTHLQHEVAQLLEIAADQIDVHQSLNTMGFDSIMAVKLRNCVQIDLAVNVPIIRFIEDISIFDLAAEINEQLTQIDRNREVEPENNEPSILSDVQNSNWIEIEL